MAASNHIRYVQRSKDGRLYFRKGGFRCHLKSPDGSEELRDEVDQILARLAQIEAASMPSVGTIGEALDAYVASVNFRGSAQSTQSDYSRRLDEIKADVGDVGLVDVTAEFVSALRAGWLTRGHRVASLNYQVLKNACIPAVYDGRIPVDPFQHQGKIKRPHDAGEPNPAWRDDEVDLLISAALAGGHSGLARAIALGRWAGFRRSEICAIPVSARISVNDENSKLRYRLYWLTKKGNIVADKLEDPRLTKLLDETPDHAVTIAYNAAGKPYNWRSLNQALDRLIARVAKTGQVRPDLTLHGLRHTRGVELATAGASDAEIMSQLEHRTTHAAQIYRRQAQRRALADAAQSKIDDVLQRRAQQTRQPDGHEVE